MKMLLLLDAALRQRQWPKILTIFYKRWVFASFFLLGLAFALRPYYADGTLVLGGEADFILNYTQHLKKCGFAWLSDYASGMTNMSPSGTGLNILMLSLIEKLGQNIQLTNFVLIFLMYLMPFLGMFLVGCELKAAPFVAFAAALFFAINPFTLNYLTSLNQMNVFSIAAMPFFLWVILKYYKTDRLLFFWHGFVSLCFSFANTNQPMIIVLQISIAISLIFASFHHDRELVLRTILRKYLLLFVAFILFNATWILGAVSAISAAQKIYTQSTASTWLSVTVEDSGSVLARAFNLKMGLGTDPSYNFFTFWNNLPIAHFILPIPLIILIYFILLSKNSIAGSPFNRRFLGVWLCILFLLKGTSAPFGFIYKLLFKYVPFFYIFKSPVEKFGVLYIFVFAILLLKILMDISDEHGYRFARTGMICFLSFCLFPIATGNLIPDYRCGTMGIATRRFIDRPAYSCVKKEIDASERDGRVLSFPGLANYQLCLVNFGGKLYTGIDPILMNTQKAFLAPEHHEDTLYNSLFANNYRRVLGIYNIEKILVNEGAIPWFGYIGPSSTKAIEDVLGSFMKSERCAEFIIYDNVDYFLPRIYPVALPAESQQ